MADAVLYDAVTLVHFGTIDRLDILETRHGHRPEPHWTEAVHDEIDRGANLGIDGCRRVMAASWLGDPIAPSSSDQRGVVSLHIGLNDGRRPPVEHAGEAESIYFADTLGAIFATDDNAAFDFAVNRLGVARVIDTVSILRDAISMDELTAVDAAALVEAIRAADRDIRRVHPMPMTAGDFER